MSKKKDKIPDKLDVIKGFRPFPEGDIYDVRRLAFKINEIIDYLHTLPLPSNTKTKK